MKKNMGSTDKAIRLVVALIIVVLAIAKVVTGIWAVVLLILAGIFVLTSVVSFCPLYTLFGMNTSKTKE